MILLSAQERMPMKEIAQSCSVNLNRVSYWFDRYESEGFSGLIDRPMSHSKSSPEAYDADQILECVRQSPQNLNQAVACLAEKHQIVTHKGILKRFLKKRLDLASGA